MTYPTVTLVQAKRTLTISMLQLQSPDGSSGTTCHMLTGGGHTQSSQSPTPPVFMGGIMSEVICTSHCQVPFLPILCP